MRAVQIAGYGGEPMLVTAAKPRPGPGEALLRVEAVGVNPVEWKIARGDYRAFMPHKFPLTPGAEGAGTIEALGDGVEGWQAGDAVIAYTSLLRSGFYAEYVAVPVSDLAKRAPNLPAEQQAGLPVGSLTAWQAMVDTAGLKQGQTVLIHAAAGGVGSQAVQIAKIVGATAIGTCSAANVGYVRSLGADRAIDYKAERFEDVARDVDVVFDLIGGETLARSFACLKRGGTLVTAVGQPDQAKAAELGITASFIGVKPDGFGLSRAVEAMQAGEIKVEVSRIYRLEQVAEAWGQSQAGHVRGKLILVP